jgi:hypothetical protein
MLLFEVFGSRLAMEVVRIIIVLEQVKVSATGANEVNLKIILRAIEQLSVWTSND